MKSIRVASTLLLATIASFWAAQPTWAQG